MSKPGNHSSPRFGSYKVEVFIWNLCTVAWPNGTVQSGAGPAMKAFMRVIKHV